MMFRLLQRKTYRHVQQKSLLGPARCLSERGPPSAARTWALLKEEASAKLRCPTFNRFRMSEYLKKEVLMHDSLEESLSHLIGCKFDANDRDNNVDFEAAFHAAFRADPDIAAAAAADLHRFAVVDPAAEGLLGPFLFFKGFQATTSARVAHYFWNEPDGQGRMIARLIHSEAADVYGVDIHPGAKLGKGVIIDHATGVVIGETAIVGDNTYLMHDITLGATGNSKEHDRHPKVGANVLLGAGCTILGNISIGDNAVVAAAALVNKAVPSGYTAVGVPARMLPPRD